MWRDYRRAVWQSAHLSFIEKLETSLFLLVFHVPVLSALGLLIIGLWMSGVAEPFSATQLSVLWTLLFLGPMLELGAGLLLADADRRDAFALVLFLPVFFVSIALTTKAWFDGLIGRPYTWVKTRRARELDVQAVQP